MQKYLLLVVSMLMAHATFCSDNSKLIPTKGSALTFLKQHAIGFCLGGIFYNLGIVPNSAWTPVIGGAAYVLGESARSYAHRHHREGRYWREAGGVAVGVVASGVMWAVGFKSALDSPKINSFIASCDKLPTPMLEILPKPQTLLNWNKSYHLGAAGASLVGIAGVGYMEKKIPLHNKIGFWGDAWVGQPFDEHFLD